MVTEDEEGYTGLKQEKELIGSLIKSEYSQLKPHSAVYEEIPDSSNIEHNEDHYEYVADESADIPPTNERYINQAVAKGTEDEHGYDYPQIQPEVYEEIADSIKDQSEMTTHRFLTQHIRSITN